MKAIVFEYKMPRLAFATVMGKLTPRAYVSPLGPTRLLDIPEPKLPAEDWCIVRTRLCGICGSDSKLVFLDANFDNPLTSLVSFPIVPGHEVTGVIEQVGSGVKDRRVGEHVLLNPWLSCAPRGIQPLCPACQNGLYFLCEHFHDGDMATGLHTGNSRTAIGGFAPLFPAHESQLFPIPASVSDDQAVLGDPFSVALHAVLKAPPPEGSHAVVYGCGMLGLLTLAVLHSFHPKTHVIAIARNSLQEKLAKELGARLVICARTEREITEAIGAHLGLRLEKPSFSGPWLMGGVDVVYDTVGSPKTLETGLRFTRPRGSIVVTGVAQPQRYEWTLLYFKEINLIGSNAFGVEEFEGQRLHALQIYLNLLDQKRVQIPDMVTHRFRQDQYKEALLIAHNKDRHLAVKVAFDYTL